MTRRAAGRVVLALALLAGVPARGAEEDEEAVQTVTGFRVPEYDAQNNLKSQLFGAFAKVLPGGLIDITDLKMEFFQDGKLDMTVTAPQCTYDQDGGVAKSDAEVEIVRENMVVTGRGFSWEGKAQRFQILHEAKVVLKQARQRMETGVKK